MSHLNMDILMVRAVDVSFKQGHINDKSSGCLI